MVRGRASLDSWEGYSSNHPVGQIASKIAAEALPVAR